MSNLSKVSVIIPTYNDSEYLPGAIESALQQTYSNVEIIVVNDGSTRSRDKDYLKSVRGQGITVIDVENGGLAMARNIGIKKSGGEYFVPLDADDKLDPCFIEKCMEFISKDDDLGVVYTDQVYFGAENRILTMLDFDFPFILVKNHVSVSSLVRRTAYNAVERVNGYGYNPNMRYGYEDWDFWISVYEVGWKLSCLHERLFYYRKRTNSMSINTLKHHDFLIKKLIENHSTLFNQNHEYIISKLQNIYMDSEKRFQSLSLSTKSQLWILKRFIRNFFAK